VSPSSGLRGMPERLSSRWPVAEAAGQFVDGITERFYLRLKPPQSFLAPRLLGIALRSAGPVHVEGFCPAGRVPHADGGALSYRVFRARPGRRWPAADSLRPLNTPVLVMACQRCRVPIRAVITD
jgi:hypothetical protein